MKKSILWFLLPAFLIVAGSIFYGCTEKEEDLKGTIYGTVTDHLTNEPIGGVNVKLKQTGEATLTGSDGSFEFKDLDANNYSLQLSKAGYNDLDDDYIIKLEAGKRIKRDVQMSPQIASLRITDMQGNDITELDFGIEESITTKSFNIFNNGSLNITCEITDSCAWITSVSNINNPITPGQTVTVTVTIDRSRLAIGDNSTILQIISNNGSNMLTVKATGPGLPTLTTADVTNITASSATCGGNVTADGGSYVTERGICWGTSNLLSINGNHQAMGQGNGTFTCNMTNLEHGNVYYVCAYATNSRGTAYGEQKQFTTDSGLPIVSISDVNNITATSATCGGSISDNGGFAVTDKGLVWSTSQYPTLNDNHISLGSGNAPFTGSMTNLTIGTTYYVRAYATNSQGTAYSVQQPFSTGNGLPIVITINPTRDGLTVVSGGNVTSDGGYSVTERGICYSTTPYPDLSSSHSHTTNGSGTGTFSSTFTIPSQGVYYVRAYATNSVGTAYGEQLTVNHPYNDLPTFTFNGNTYRVAPPATTTMYWSDANSYCDNLTLYGYTDWRLPTRDELHQMYTLRTSIGGFGSDEYWSNTECSSSGHYTVDFLIGSVYCMYTLLCEVRPVRVEN